MAKRPEARRGYSFLIGATFLYWVSRAVLIFAVSLHISDIVYYQRLGLSSVRGGLWPFLHFPFEYPPLAFLPILLPAWGQNWLGSDSSSVYRALFALTLLPLDWLLFRRYRRSPSLPGGAHLYVLFTSLFPLLVFDRLDLVVGILVAWPFLAPRLSRPPGDRAFAWSWALGGAFKLVPFLLLPLRFCDRSFPWSAGRVARLFAPAAFFLLLSLGIAFAASGQLPFLSQHAQRGVQVESVVGGVAMVARAMDMDVSVANNFGAQHIESHFAWRLAAKFLFLGGLAATMIAVLWFAMDGAITSLAAAWLVLLAFVALGYVLSPQFLLWLIPLAPAVAGLLEGWRRAVFLALFALTLAATSLHFYFYWNYINGTVPALVLLCSRNGALLLLLALSWRWLPHRSFDSAMPLESRPSVL